MNYIITYSCLPLHRHHSVVGRPSCRIPHASQPAWSGQNLIVFSESVTQCPSLKDPLHEVLFGKWNTAVLGPLYCRISVSSSPLPSLLTQALSMSPWLFSTPGFSVTPPGTLLQEAKNTALVQKIFLTLVTDCSRITKVLSCFFPFLLNLPSSVNVRQCQPFRPRRVPRAFSLNPVLLACSER